MRGCVRQRVVFRPSTLRCKPLLPMKRLLAQLILAGSLYLSISTNAAEDSAPTPAPETTNAAPADAANLQTNAVPDTAKLGEGQTNSAPVAGSDPADTSSTNTAPELEKILLITFEDPPAEIIKALAEQARMSLQLDPRILNGIDADGKPLEKWSDSISVRWTNLTALEALEEFLARYGMRLVRDSEGKVLRITYPASAQAADPTTNAVTSVQGEDASDPSAKDQTPKVELIPIRIQEQPVLEAVTTLADMARINFQFDPRVTSGLDAEGKPYPFLTNVITLKWENVTAQDALEQVLANHNLMLVQLTNSKIARVTFRPAPAQEPLVTKVIQLKYAAPTNMVQVLKANLSERSKVNVDTRTSSLVVQTTEREYATVDDILLKLDTPTRQVLIEAKMLETALNPKSVKCVDWSGSLS
jgi:hypothetical protein